MYGLTYSERALAFLESIPVKFRRQIIKRIESLLGDPFPTGHRLIRATSDDAERVYRIRSGDYRVLYVVRHSPTHIVVLDIGHRKDVYR